MPWVEVALAASRTNLTASNLLSQTKLLLRRPTYNQWLAVTDCLHQAAANFCPLWHQPVTINSLCHIFAHHSQWRWNPSNKKRQERREKTEKRVWIKLFSLTWISIQFLLRLGGEQQAGRALLVIAGEVLGQKVRRRGGETTMVVVDTTATHCSLSLYSTPHQCTQSKPPFQFVHIF